MAPQVLRLALRARRMTRFGLGGGWGDEVGGVEEGQEDAAEGGFAAGRVVPLLEGVDASAGASGADGYGGNAAGEGDVGVGGAEAEFGAEVEVTVYGAEGLEDGRVVGEGGGGAISDGFDMDLWWTTSGFKCGKAG